MDQPGKPCRGFSQGSLERFGRALIVEKIPLVIAAMTLALMLVSAATASPHL